MKLHFDIIRLRIGRLPAFYGHVEDNGLTENLVTAMLFVRIYVAGTLLEVERIDVFRILRPCRVDADSSPTVSIRSFRVNLRTVLGLDIHQY